MKLRGAVIGYGFISSKGHIPAYLEREKKKNDVEIVAVADLSDERRLLAAKALPGVKIFSSADDLLRDPTLNLDFIDIATPPCDHARIARAALEMGLHVLCEKPLTTDLDDAKDLLNRAKAAKRVLFPVHNYKHAPVVKAIRDVVKSGRVGEIRSVTLSTFRNTHAKGVLEWNTHWRRHQSYSGGGIATDHGSHSFYLMFDWLGDYPTSITAKMSNLSPKLFDTEDNFSAVLTFPNGLAHCHLTWTAGVRKVLYTLQGTKGAIRVEDDDIEVAIQEKTDGLDVAQGAVRWVTEKKKISSDWMDASHVTWFDAIIDEFKRAIEVEDYVGREAQDAYRCIEIITRAYESSNNACQELKLYGISPKADLIPTSKTQWRNHESVKN